MKRLLVMTVLSSAITLVAQAADTQKKVCKHAFQPSETNWNLNIGLGYTANTGNTVNTNGAANLHLEYSPKLWQYILDLNAQIQSRNHKRTEERYFEGFQARYHYKPSENYIYGLARSTQDPFATYTRTALVSAGYGWTLIDNCRWYLLWQLGPGARYEKVSGTGDTSTRPVATSQTELSYFITDNTTAKEAFIVEANKDNTYWQSITSLQTKLVKDFGLKVSFQMNYNTKIPPESTNIYKLDTTTIIALTYTFEN